MTKATKVLSLVPQRSNTSVTKFFLDYLGKEPFEIEQFEWLLLSQESTMRGELLEAIHSAVTSIQRISSSLALNVQNHLAEMLCYYCTHVGTETLSARDRTIIMSIADMLDAQEANRVKLGLLKQKTEPTECLSEDSLKYFSQNAFIMKKHQKTAEVMTVIDWNLFSKIRTHEFFNQAWSGVNKVTLAPNLTALAQRFDRVTYWVVTKILQSNPNVQHLVIEGFIKIMWKLYKLNNFHTMCMVLCGLNQSCVSRLKNVWKKVNRQIYQQFEQIDELMSPKNNHFAYREELKNIDSLNVPVFPYVPLILRDLTYIYDGNPAISGEYNVEKQSLLGREIKQFLKYQHRSYAHLKSNVDEVAEFYFTNLPKTIFDEEQLYSLSFLHQPQVGSNNPPPTPKPSDVRSRESNGRTKSLTIANQTSTVVLEKTLNMIKEKPVFAWSVNDAVCWAQELGIAELHAMIVKFRIDGETLLACDTDYLENLNFLDQDTVPLVIEAIEFIRSHYVRTRRSKIPVRTKRLYSTHDIENLRPVLRAHSAVKSGDWGDDI